MYEVMNSFVKLCLLLLIVSKIDCYKNINSFSNLAKNGQHLPPPHTTSVNNVKIRLYYESLCHDCRIFDSTQLKEVVIKLSEYIDLKTYPYGNAKTRKVNDKYVISCQHGPPECYGNQLHACAIEELQNNTLAVLFNACLMDETQQGAGSDDRATDVCGKSFGINSNRIKQCANSEKGHSLLKYYGDESRKVNYDHVPYILVNGKEFDPGNQNFMETICNAMSNPPEACNKKSNRYQVWLL